MKPPRSPADHRRAARVGLPPPPPPPPDMDAGRELLLARGLPDGLPLDDRPLLHVVWIGSEPPPLVRDCIESWRRLNPTWRVLVWRDHRGWINQSAIDRMVEWNGKADVMRYEILWAWGGVVVDADSEAVRPLDAGDFGERIQRQAVACFENETCRRGLIACGFMGGPAGSPLWRACVEACWHADMRQLSWVCVGPEMLTRVAARVGGTHVYPARCFIPTHATGVAAPGDAPIFANQLWGNTHARYPDPRAHGKYPLPPPVVSVLVPAFGAAQARYLGDAVASVLGQTFGAWECLIVSSDAACTATARALARHDPQRMRAIEQAPAGVARARNTAAREARGRLLLPLDADDKIAPTYLARAVDAIGAATHAIVHADVAIFGEQTGSWQPTWSRAGVLVANCLPNSSLHTRALWEAAGGWDETIGGFEDWAYWIACSRQDPVVTRIPEPLMLHRRWTGSRSTYENPGAATWTAQIHARHPDLYPAG